MWTGPHFLVGDAECVKTKVCMFDHCFTTMTRIIRWKSNTFVLVFFPSVLFCLCLLLPSLFCLPSLTLSLSPFLFLITPCAYIILSTPPHMYLATLGTCICFCGGDLFCVWSPATVCTPDSAQLLLYSGGGLEVPDHTGLPPPHHRLLSWAADFAEWLHWRLLWPPATWQLGKVCHFLKVLCLFFFYFLIRHVGHCTTLPNPWIWSVCPKVD